MSLMDDYQSRVTLDIDGGSDGWQLNALRAESGLYRAGADRVDVSISSSGNGLHLVGWFVESIDWSTKIRIRRTLGDDPKRVEIDQERRRHGIYTDVLWKTKRSHRGPSETPDNRPGKDRSFETVSDALAHIRMRSWDPAERVKSLAEDGHRAAPEMAPRAQGAD
jgi:hypothetical protein